MKTITAEQNGLPATLNLKALWQKGEWLAAWVEGEADAAGRAEVDLQNLYCRVVFIRAIGFLATRGLIVDVDCPLPRAIAWAVRRFEKAVLAAGLLGDETEKLEFLAGVAWLKRAAAPVSRQGG
jgi:hypothetical protein